MCNRGMHDCWTPIPEFSEKRVTPSAQNNICRTGAPIYPCKWCKTTVAKILSQQEYCGDVINFKTYSKYFKNKGYIEISAVAESKITQHKPVRA